MPTSTPATEAGTTAAAGRRDELLSRSGLLLGRGSGEAGFYHLSVQEFLAAEHLARTRREPDWFTAVVAARAPVPEWRLTLSFLFGRMLKRNGEQWALDAARDLLATQDRAAVRANPAPAVVCADWIEMLTRKGLNLPGAALVVRGRLGLARDRVRESAGVLAGQPLQHRQPAGGGRLLLGGRRLFPLGRGAPAQRAGMGSRRARTPGLRVPLGWRLEGQDLQQR